MKLRSTRSVTGLVILVLLATNTWTYVRLRRAEARVDKLDIGTQSLEARIEELLARPRAETERAAVPEAVPPPVFEAPLPQPQVREAPSAAPETPSAGDDYVPPEEIHRILNEAIDEHFRDLELSETERRELADAVYAFREAQDALRDMTYSSENAEEFRRLQAQRKASWRKFEEITNMTPAEFMRRVDPGGGITNEDADTGPIVFEYLEEHQP